MAWRLDEVWLDTDVLWFREQEWDALARALTVPAQAIERFEAGLSVPFTTGLDASRRRRLAAAAARKHRRLTRTAPAVALVVGSAAMLPLAALRHGSGSPRSTPLESDPPSLTFRFDPTRGAGGATRRPATPRTPAAVRAAARATDLARVDWHRATSAGLQYSGSLTEGTQLPLRGPDWVTWNPVTDSVPNLPYRLYGNERTIRSLVTVVAGYRTANPEAPQVVVGDISFRHGGTMDGHVSHQNGLDVDVYYPRLDRHLSAPIATSQIDRRLSQTLLDRFVAAGAQIVFVGFSTGLHGQSGVVVPYPNHENHMHVRFPVPPG